MISDILIPAFLINLINELLTHIPEPDMIVQYFRLIQQAEGPNCNLKLSSIQFAILKQIAPHFALI